MTTDQSVYQKIVNEIEKGDMTTFVSSYDAGLIDNTDLIRLITTAGENCQNDILTKLLKLPINHQDDLAKEMIDCYTTFAGNLEGVKILIEHQVPFYGISALIAYRKSKEAKDATTRKSSSSILDLIIPQLNKDELDRFERLKKNMEYGNSQEYQTELKKNMELQQSQHQRDCDQLEEYNTITDSSS
jgi:hypothetical protein